MTEEKFVRVVERTANAAIETGRHAETVIHDMIKVLYGRKDIKKLLPDGWIIANDCSECAYKDDPGDSDACYWCYNKLFNKNIIRLDPGPYTNNFKSKDEKKVTDNDPPRWCMNCVYNQLNVDDGSPCYDCLGDNEKPNFTPIEKSTTLDEKEEKDPEEQKHVEVEDGKYCYNCKYEELKVQEQPCYSCYWKAARPSFTPKEG